MPGGGLEARGSQRHSTRRHTYLHRKKRKNNAASVFSDVGGGGQEALPAGTTGALRRGRGSEGPARRSCFSPVRSSPLHRHLARRDRAGHHPQENPCLTRVTATRGTLSCKQTKRAIHRARAEPRRHGKRGILENRTQRREPPETRQATRTAWPP